MRIALWALFAPLVISIPTISQAAQVSDVAGGACISTVSDSTNVIETRTGNECIVVFKNVGTVAWTVPSNILNNTIRILVIGGGGGGNGRTDGTGWVGGGGGGGDYIESTSAIVTPNQNDSVTVGNGGAWGSSVTNPSNGGASSFVDKFTINAIGGGAGGGVQYNGGSNQTQNAGANGGSGGGGGTYYGNAGSDIGSGTGNNGGAASSGCCSSGGGGGAGGAGGTAPSNNTGGAAGLGLSNSITGSPVFYAGGGAGTGCTASGTSNAASGGTASNTAGAANTGAGGGGGGANNAGCTNSTTGAGAGGSGIVIIRYTLRTSSASTLPITSNLVLDLQGSNYSGSGSWLDSSGNYYDAALLGGVTYSSNDQAFSFDGSSGYMLLNDGPKFQYFNNSPFTLNVMFNPSSITGTRFLFGRFNGSVVGNYFLALTSGTPWAQREIAPWNVYGTTSVVTSNKYLLSYVYDGTNLKLYENGVLDSQTVFSGAVPSGTPVSPLIGASYQSSSPSNFFAGKIYAVNLYSAALTQAQIQQNYAFLLGNGSLGPTLSVPANQVQYRANGAITATLGNPGKVTFYVKGKKIPGCVGLSPSSKYENFTVTCNYKPSLHGNLQVTATYTPTISYFPQNLSTVQNFAVTARTGKR
ncbi:MAG: hypothetical protein F2519_05905 [Actinobacteria bacterium]|nr:hypothetical protein [Actinomycetota bacterium]MTA05091.1 hypothetical protein [Actinomycetota bacterium]